MCGLATGDPGVGPSWWLCVGSCDTKDSNEPLGVPLLWGWGSVLECSRMSVWEVVRTGVDGLKSGTQSGLGEGSHDSRVRSTF